MARYVNIAVSNGNVSNAPFCKLCLIKNKSLIVAVKALRYPTSFFRIVCFALLIILIISGLLKSYWKVCVCLLDKCGNNGDFHRNTTLKQCTVRGCNILFIEQTSHFIY